MPKLIADAGGSPKKRSGKRRWIIVVAIIVVLLLAAGVAYVLALKHGTTAPRPSTGAKSTSDPADTRSAAVKAASSTAAQQANNGNPSGAIATIDSAIASTQPSKVTDLVSLYQQKATIAVNAGQTSTAIAAQKQAIALQPDNWALVQALGDMYTYAGDTADANAAYTQANAVAQRTGGTNSEHGITQPGEH